MTNDHSSFSQVTKANAEAEEFLRENPDLKGVHSNASVRALLSKAPPTPPPEA